MQVREKTHRIDVTIEGSGADRIAEIVRRSFPDAEFFDDDETVRWEDTDLAADIRARKTPGKLLRAYRERAGLTIVDLAGKVGTKYPNVSAMENDRRVIGLAVARKLGDALGVDYRKFLE